MFSSISPVDDVFLIFASYNCSTNAGTRESSRIIIIIIPIVCFYGLGSLIASYSHINITKIKYVCTQIRGNFKGGFFRIWFLLFSQSLQIFDHRVIILTVDSYNTLTIIIINEIDWDELGNVFHKKFIGYGQCTKYA